MVKGSNWSRIVPLQLSILLSHHPTGKSSPVETPRYPVPIDDAFTEIAVETIPDRLTVGHLSRPKSIEDGSVDVLGMNESDAVCVAV